MLAQLPEPLLARVLVVIAALAARGWAHVPGLTRGDFTELAATAGRTVHQTMVALSPEGHTYLAKPGPVPLHTDHPDVDVIGWWCEAQDADDGANLVFDTRPVIDGLDGALRRMLHEVEMICPPLAGGPPTEVRPVLRASPDGGSPALFCSPWLRAAHPVAAHVEALEELRRQLSAAIARATIEVRLAPGDAIFVDNRRMLHGRRAIRHDSARRLHRRWIQTVDRPPR